MGIEQKDNILDEDGALIPLSLFVRRIKISIFALPDFFYEVPRTASKFRQKPSFVYTFKKD